MKPAQQIERLEAHIWALQLDLQCVSTLPKARQHMQALRDAIRGYEAQIEALR